MAADSLAYATIADLGKRFRSKELSPVEYATDCLRRIERLDKTLHSFITVTADRALADARAAEAAIRAGSAGPLAGIPIAYKDLYATKGILTTAGSALLADWIPEDDCTCVRLLQDAGMVMLGKLITHEFAFGIQFPNHRFPAARNPWNPDHIPGGSSSGSGAALAAGLTVGALGSDTGGSIRGPAAFCGIVGLKPTYGRVSRAGAMPLSWSNDHVGPMARTVRDCALLLQVMAGRDPLDATSSLEPVPDYMAALGRSLAGLRVGLIENFYFQGVHAEMDAAVRRAAEVITQLGARVSEPHVPDPQTMSDVTNIVSRSEAATIHARLLRERPHDVQPVVRSRLELGTRIPAYDYLQALRLRARLTRAFVTEVFSEVDVLMTPVIPEPAPSLAHATEGPVHELVARQGRFSRLTRPFNGLGLPVLSVPCGFSAAGLPLAFQIAGRPFDEPTVLRLGDAYQQATTWHTRRAPVD